MSDRSPRRRTGVLLLLVPISLAVSTGTQNIQTVLFVVSLAYLSVAGGFLWVSSRDAPTPAVVTRDFLLRRGGAWTLILFGLAVSLVITQELAVGLLTALTVSVAGAFDQASLRVNSRSA